MKIYLLSGMGADERAFAKINLSPHRIEYVPWIKPLHKESLKDYAARMASSLEEHQIIMGLSFGGLVAVEIVKIKPMRKVFIISSCKTSSEIPFYYKICRYIPLHRLLPLHQVHRWHGAMNFFFGNRSPAEQKRLKEIIMSVHSDLMSWSLHQFIHWNNRTLLPNIIHIHGTKDNLLPIRFTQPHYIIKDGNHYMIYDKATEITSILHAEFSLIN